MDLITATNLVKKMTAASYEPQLADSDVQAVLTIWRRPDATGALPSPVWAAQTAYTAGMVISAQGHAYSASTGGTSGSYAPAWDTTPGATVTDGTVVWTETGPDPWLGAYNLNAAAADLWRMKAAAVAQDFDFGADGGTYQRDQVSAHCLEMAARYDKERW